MNSRDEQHLPAQRAPNLPVSARNFTTQELEAVIRRAVELQAGSSARTEEGVPEDDVVRIGQELGFDPATVRRAMAEVRALPPEERGALFKVVGPATIRAARVVPRPAASTAPQLEHYLRETELMLPQRRFPERTRYERDSSLVAGLTRFTRGLTRSHQRLNLPQLDVAVSAIDAGSCLVEVSVDLAGTRGGLAAGMLGSGSAAAAGLAATVWATPVADPFMLLGIPVLAGAWYGMRAIYGTIQKSAQDKLESFLDRVEHDDLT
jgi:hypothetical protein